MKQNKFLYEFLFLFLAFLIFTPFSYVNAVNSSPGSITINVPAGFTGPATVNVTVVGNNGAITSLPIILTINAASAPTATLTTTPSSCTAPCNINVAWTAADFPAPQGRFAIFMNGTVGSSNGTDSGWSDWVNGSNNTGTSGSGSTTASSQPAGTYTYCIRAVDASWGTGVNLACDTTTVTPPVPCGNGANNPPTCNTCTAPLVWNSTSCVTPPCGNGANNPPTCNTCTAPLTWSGSSCVSANLPPVVFAGQDKSIAQPTSTSAPTGTSATDSDGTISSTVWSFISGPGPTPTITNNGTLNPSFGNMTSTGTYVFLLTATDNLGATGFDNMQVAVSPSGSPTCGSIVLQAPTTTAVSGTFWAEARGVQNATVVNFPTWGSTTGGQDDLVWYPGTKQADGTTWRANINLANHKLGNPEYGTFRVDVYMNNASVSDIPCGQTTFTRTLPVDLTASTPTQTTATINTAQTFTSTITNSGTAATGASFYNVYQVATGAGGTGTVTTLTSTPSPMSALVASGTNTASYSYTFTGAIGTRSVRFCADNNTSMVGTIIETNEGNNCSGWRDVVVSNPDCANRANNYPTCNICTAPLAWNGSSCVNVCANGANNYPTCNTCTAPLVWNGSSCVAVCGNGANNPPTCNTCTAPLVWNGSSCTNAPAPAPDLKVTAWASWSGNGRDTVWNYDHVNGPIEIYTNAPYALSWGAIANATSCTLDGNAVSINGGTVNTYSATLLTQTHTLRCVNAIGQPGTDTATVTVPPGPLTFTKSCNVAGDHVTFNWTLPSGYTGGYIRGDLYADVFSGLTTTLNITPGQTYNVILQTMNSTNGAWSGASLPLNFSCFPPSLPDLTASAPSPATATVGTSLTFTSTITNSGSAATGASFNNFFQVATAANGGGTNSTLSVNSRAALGAGASGDVTSSSYTFPSAGTYSVRTCADNNASWVGTITESNEGNNCSGWTNVTTVCTANYTWNGTICALNTYTVTGTAGSNGTISPSSRTVNHGSTTTFTVTPNAGYTASASGCGGSLVGTTYTTGAITANCAVTASFTTGVCANGANNYPTCSPFSPPTNLILSCPSPGTTVSASWTAPSGWNTFYTRASLSGVNLGAPAWDDNFVGTVKTFTSIPGQTYYVWIHTKNPSNGSSSADINGTITCTVSTVAPTITTTSPVTNITQTTATGGGNVTSNGGATVTVSGIAWSTSSNPTTANSKTTNGWAIGGPWTSNLTGLTTNTLYHVRAYATNSVGTAYGSDVTFTTSGPAPVNGVLGDANGKAYSNGSSSYSPYVQCFAGTSSNTSFPSVGVPANWICYGLNGGINSGIGSASQDAPAAPVTITSDKPKIVEGGSAILTWSGGSGSCTAGGGWSGAKATSGSLAVSPTVTTTYTITCNNGSPSVTITVSKKPIIIED